MDKEKIKNLPELPGVYIMKDESGVILYIGKAAYLKKRVSSYFRNNSGLSPRIGLMAGKVANLDYVVTGSEAEALILESALIKKHKPRYNIELKDDKSYPYLAITKYEKYPRLIIVRKKGPLQAEEKKRQVFYGPYTDVKLLRKAVAVMKRIFPLRTCNRIPKKICLNYRIGQCLGPCVGGVNNKTYSAMVKELEMFLGGDRLGLIGELSRNMRRAAEKRDYEKAAALRDRIRALNVVPERRERATPYEEAEGLKYLLRLKRVPRRIEAFDVSNISGKEAVGSMVTFVDGKPAKDSYRRFRIRGTARINDYDMMREIVRRRYARVKKDRLPAPDLIIIDGGKGHLNAARNVLEETGFGNLPVIGIAKKFEHIYVKGKREPVIFSHSSPVLHLMQRLRDEAHRFAIGYHRVLRRKKVERQFTELDRKKKRHYNEVIND